MAKVAVVVIDMTKDNADEDSPFGIGEEGRKIIPNLQQLIATARQRGIQVIFANDSFMPGDFLFQGKIKPHCIRGTEGENVIDELKPGDTDIVLPKRRMSAFFKTDLDVTLRTLGIDTIAVCGISTQGCVLTTAFDGMANDFYVIVLEDCCACHKKSQHDNAINLLRAMPTAPRLLIKDTSEFFDSLP